MIKEKLSAFIECPNKATLLDIANTPQIKNHTLFGSKIMVLSKTKHSVNDFIDDVVIAAKRFYSALTIEY